MIALHLAHDLADVDREHVRMLLHERGQPRARCGLGRAERARCTSPASPSSGPGGNSAKKFDAEAVPVDLAQARDAAPTRALPAMSNVSASPSLTPQRLGDAVLERHAGVGAARLRRPERSRRRRGCPSAASSAHDRLNSRSARRRARVSPYLRGVERRAVHLDEPAAHHRVERHVGADAALRAARARRRPGRAAR